MVKIGGSLGERSKRFVISRSTGETLGTSCCSFFGRDDNDGDDDVDGSDDDDDTEDSGGGTCSSCSVDATANVDVSGD